MSTAVETRPLISLHPSASVQEAAQLMNDCSIACLGVLDKDKNFSGIVTERDITAFVSRGKDPAASVVADIVNDFPVVMDGPVSDEAAIERMRSAHIRHLIVKVDGDFRIVSIRDLLSPALRDGYHSPAVAADLMTSPAVACRANAFFEEVAETLADGDISGMPVVDDRGHLVGVISERDLAHALGGPLVKLAVRRHSTSATVENLSEVPRDSRRVKDIMSTHVVSAPPTATVRELADLALDHDIGRIPVVLDGRLIGVVTRGDLLACLSGTVREHRAPVASVVVGSDDRVARPSFDWGPHGHEERSEWPSRRHSRSTHH
jgi:CBS domain-containing protein